MEGECDNPNDIFKSGPFKLTVCTIVIKCLEIGKFDRDSYVNHSTWIIRKRYWYFIVFWIWKRKGTGNFSSCHLLESLPLFGLKYGHCNRVLSRSGTWAVARLFLRWITIFFFRYLLQLEVSGSECCTLETIRELLSREWAMLIRHTYGKGNLYANWLANHTFYCLLEFIASTPVR